MESNNINTDDELIIPIYIKILGAIICITFIVVGIIGMALSNFLDCIIPKTGKISCPYCHKTNINKEPFRHANDSDKGYYYCQYCPKCEKKIVYYSDNLPLTECHNNILKYTVPIISIGCLVIGFIIMFLISPPIPSPQKEQIKHI